jgi:hypothetical protein
MKKLQLKIEELTVESFCADEGERPGRGTVRAHQKYTFYCVTDVAECNTGTCGGGDSSYCQESYAGTCVAASCVNSCDTFCAWTTPCFC